MKLIAGFLAGGVLFAQLPIPKIHKPRHQTTAAESAPELVQAAGTVRSIDKTSLVLDADDTRILTIALSEATVIDPKDLKPGDHVAVESTQDEEGFLHAVTVALAKAPPKPSKTGKPEANAEAGKPGNAEAAKPAADADEPPPRLKRGIPPKPKHAETEEEEAAPVAGPTAAAPAPAVPQPDPVIEKAREIAAAFTEGLPSYVCQQLTTRYISTARLPVWNVADVVSAVVVYEDGRERYSKIVVNNKPTKKSMDDIGGSTSSGEFGTLLRDVLSRSTAAEFDRRGNETVSKVQTIAYDFSVPHESSHWRVHVASQEIFPAYEGTIWIDKRNSRVVRIETKATDIPKDFPMDTVESTLEYGYVRLAATQEFLVPVHSEQLSCQRGTTNCSRNAIDFRNYHKYSGESSVTFDK